MHDSSPFTCQLQEICINSLAVFKLVTTALYCKSLHISSHKPVPNSLYMHKYIDLSVNIQLIYSCVQFVSLLYNHDITALTVMSELGKTDLKKYKKKTFVMAADRNQKTNIMQLD